MARPKIPLISKRNALLVALDIIDREGIDALSIRRLAERLNVNGASLYHHFANKDEIVVGAAKVALEEVRTPQGHEEPWRLWILRNARRLRDAYRAHPDLVPVMLRRAPLGIGTSQLDATAILLEEEGVPIGAIAPMLEALEFFAIGSALHDAYGDGDEAQADIGTCDGSPYGRARESRSVSSDEIYEMVCEQIIDASLKKALGPLFAETRPAAPTPSIARNRSSSAAASKAAAV